MFRVDPLCRRLWKARRMDLVCTLVTRISMPSKSSLSKSLIKEGRSVNSSHMAVFHPTTSRLPAAAMASSSSISTPRVPFAGSQRTSNFSPSTSSDGRKPPSLALCCRSESMRVTGVRAGPPPACCVARLSTMEIVSVAPFGGNFMRFGG